MHSINSINSALRTPQSTLSVSVTNILSSSLSHVLAYLIFISLIHCVRAPISTRRAAGRVSLMHSLTKGVSTSHRPNTECTSPGVCVWGGIVVGLESVSEE